MHRKYILPHRFFVSNGPFFVRKTDKRKIEYFSALIYFMHVKSDVWVFRTYYYADFTTILKINYFTHFSENLLTSTHFLEIYSLYTNYKSHLIFSLVCKSYFCINLLVAKFKILHLA